MKQVFPSTPTPVKQLGEILKLFGLKYTYYVWCMIKAVGK